MKWKKITIVEEPIEEILKEMKISQRSFGRMAGTDVATTHKALKNELILCEKTARKMMVAVEYLQKHPEICEKLRKIMARSSKGWHISREEAEKRNRNIVKLRESPGLALQEIGKRYNITKERVRQILLDEEIRKLKKNI